MQRREFLKSTLSYAAGVLGATPLWCAAQSTENTQKAQSAPADLRLVVPFPPGGGGDVLARCVMTELSQHLGRSLVVYNRPGAGGNIGTSHVVKSKPQTGLIGYVTNGIMCVNPTLYPSKAFDPLIDLKPIAGLTTIGLTLAVNAKVMPEVKCVDDLVAFAKAHPGEVAYASAGVGTTSHLAGVLFEREAGLQLNQIPHAGGAAAVNEVIAGRIPFLIDVMPNLIGHIQTGSLLPLAVTTPVRSPLLPAVTTFAENGLPGVTLYAWDGLAGPLEMSDEQAQEIALAAQFALSDAKLKERLLRLGAVPSWRGSEEFRQFIFEENQKWRPLAIKARARHG